MVEVQKPMVFCEQQKSQNTLSFCTSTTPIPAEGCASTAEIAKNHGFLHLDHADPRRGSREHCRNRKNPWVFAPRPRRSPQRVARAGRGFDSSLVRERASQDATCILQQLAQSNLRRAEQVAQSNLHRATCTEQLAQSNLQGAQFAQSNLQGPTCRSNLRGATCAEQLAQCNLRRATYADQLAPTSLRRAPCLVLSRACFTKCREKERILQRWADLACDVLLSGQPWSSFLLLPFQRQPRVLGHVGPVPRGPCVFVDSLPGGVPKGPLVVFFNGLEAFTFCHVFRVQKVLWCFVDLLFGGLHGCHEFCWRKSCLSDFWYGGLMFTFGVCFKLSATVLDLETFCLLSKWNCFLQTTCK